MASPDSTSGRAPAFQFYPKDFLTDSNVVVMSLAERGAYITLICQCWLDGTLPSDVPRLARLCGSPLTAFRKIWPALSPCFREARRGSDRLIHPRLERERHKQAEFREEQSRKGRASAAARSNRKATGVQPKSNHGSTAVDVRLQPKPNSSISDLQSSSSDSSQRTNVRAFQPVDASEEVRERAGRFCERYGVLYQQHRKGARYLGKPNLDFLEAVTLCATWPDTRLDQIATVFLTTDHEFAEKGSRTMAQFRAMASWCDSKLVEAGIA